MVRGADFDFYDPNKAAAPAAPTPPAKPSFQPLNFECSECGAPACFGEGVSLLRGIQGVWTCAKHRPLEFRPEGRT